MKATNVKVAVGMVAAVILLGGVSVPAAIWAAKHKATTSTAEMSGDIKDKAAFLSLAASEEARTASMSATSGGRAGSYYCDGFDKSHGVFWILVPSGRVTVLDASGHMRASASGSMTPAQERNALPAGLKDITIPQIAIVVNGKTTLSTGYGTHAIKDGSGQTVLTLQVSPPN
jgi:hypothetical protein